MIIIYHYESRLTTINHVFVYYKPLVMLVYQMINGDFPIFSIAILT